MNLWELLLLALGLWTAIGVAGTALSFFRRERTKALRGLLWIAGIWVLYMAIEFTVAKTQKQQVFALGQRKCFDELCFSVVGVEEVPSFFGRNVADDGTKLLRVSVRIENKGLNHSERESLVSAYLLDDAGTRWVELPGLGGVPLTAAVPARGAIMSEPVFRIPRQTRLVGLVLTHGHAQPGVLVIGDSDSLGHRPHLMLLNP